MSEYVAESKSSEGKVKVELDFSNYATKIDLKKSTGIAKTSSFAKKIDLASLKSNVDKLDIGKLKHVPTNLSNLKSKVDKLDVDKLLPVLVDLSKLWHLLKNHIPKKDVYNAKIKDTGDITPNKNELNELSKKVKQISTKILTTDLRDKFSIINEAKYFSLEIFEHYLTFIQL